MGWMGLSSRANNSDFVHRACIASAQRFMVLSGSPEQAGSWVGMDREQSAPPDGGLCLLPRLWAMGARHTVEAAQLCSSLLFFGFLRPSGRFFPRLTDQLQCVRMLKGPQHRV